MTARFQTRLSHPTHSRLLVLSLLTAALLLYPGTGAVAQEPPGHNGRDFTPGGGPVSEGSAITWSVVSLNSVGCNNANIGFTMELAGYSGGPERFRTIVDAAGDRYMDEDAGTPGGNGTYGWHLYDSSSGGPVTANFPLPPDTPITVYFGLINGPSGPWVFERRVVLSQCNGGTIVSDDVLVTGLALAIPTLSRIGIALFAGVLALGAAWALRRRRAT